jgi:hypothetical protein
MWCPPPLVDRHDRIFLGEGHHVSSVLVLLEFHVPGEGTRDHEVIHHATVPELVLDRVHVVRAGPHDESLEVVCRRLRLVLDIVSGSHDVCHVGVVCIFVIVIIVVGYGCDPLRAPLLPILSTLDILLGALDGDVGWHHLAAVGDRFPAA